MILSRTTLILILPWMMLSCRTAKSVVAAVEVKPSGFLPNAAHLKEHRDRSPFLGNWWNPDPQVKKDLKWNANYLKPITRNYIQTNHLFSQKW